MKTNSGGLIMLNLNLISKRFYFEERRGLMTSVAVFGFKNTY